MHRGAAVAILLATAFLLSGCQYLLGLNGLNGVPTGPGGLGSFDPGVIGSFDPGDFGSFDPGNPDESLPPPIATYTSGSAAVTIGGTVTQLGGLTEPGTLYAEFGAEGSWTDGKGTYVQFYSDPSGGSGAAGFVQLDRISGGQHLAAADPSRCVGHRQEGRCHRPVGECHLQGADLGGHDGRLQRAEQQPGTDRGAVRRDHHVRGRTLGQEVVGRRW